MNKTENIIIYSSIITVLLLLFLSHTIKGQVSSNEVKATLILHFCENVSWEKELPSTFKIGYISNNDKIYSLLKPAENRIKIQGRNIAIDKIGLADVQHYQAVYFGNKDFDSITELFNTAKENNILFITDNVKDELFVLINFYDGENTVKFRVNMPNLILSGFTVKPNLLLNGGTVVDINMAYELFEERLAKSRAKLNVSNKALLEIEQELQNKDSVILLKEKELGKYTQEIEYYKEQASGLRSAFETERAQLERQRNELNDMLSKFQKLQWEFHRKEVEYEELMENLKKLKTEYDTLKHNLKTKDIVLQQQEELIFSQKKQLFLLLAFLTALCIAGFTLYRLFIMKKKHNVQLTQKVEERTHELKLSNKQYQTLFDLAPNALWETDFSSVYNYIYSLGIRNAAEFDAYEAKNHDFSIECFRRIKYTNMNKAALQLYKLDSKDQMTEFYEHLYESGILSQLISELKLFFSGKKIYTYETTRYNKQNEKIELIITLTDISDNQKDFSRVIISLVDITHLRNIENELKKHQNELEELVKEKTKDLEIVNEELKSTNEELFEKSKIISNQNTELKATLQHLQETQARLVQSEKMASLGILTAGVAHEINNPLNFIMGAYQGLKILYEKSGPEQKNTQVLLLLNALKTGVERAANIVKSLNQFSHSSKKDNEACDMHSIIDNCLVMLRNKLKNNIKVVQKYHPDKVILKGNSGNLHQVFLNIINNACQAIENKGEITLKTHMGQDRFVVEIIDTGKGIPNKDIHKIMDPFYTTKPPGEGTGLGLFITYKIIKEHNGSIDFFSEPGKGTTVRIYLPLYANLLKPNMKNT